MGNRATLVLLVLAAGLGALLLALPHLELVETGAIPVHRTVPPETAPQGGSGGAGRRVVDLSAFTETVDRPLFSENRRPPAELPPPAVVAQPVAVQAAVPPALELSAVVIDGDRRLALFRGPGGGGTSRRAEEGSEVDGWTLSAVRPDGVVLERNGETHEMALRTFKPAPAAALRPRNPAEVPRARQPDRSAEPEAAPVPRPRRPLRGPRRRSLQRRNNSS